MKIIQSPLGKHANIWSVKVRYDQGFPPAGQAASPRPSKFQKNQPLFLPKLTDRKSNPTPASEAVLHRHNEHKKIKEIAHICRTIVNNFTTQKSGLRGALFDCRYITAN